MQKAAKIRSGVLLAAALLVGLVAAIYATRSSSAGPAKTVSTAHNKTLGKTILVNSRGRSLYSLSVERHGKFICKTSSCLSVWMPLTVHKGTKPTVDVAAPHVLGERVERRAAVGSLGLAVGPLDHPERGDSTRARLPLLRHTPRRREGRRIRGPRARGNVRRMRAVVYSKAGGPDVLRLVERPVPEPGPGEVCVGVRVSGVNPTDWKARAGQLAFPEVVPNQDGAGTIDAVGDGVDASRLGERVWLWEAAWQRANGTAQEYVVLPERQAVQLPDGVSFDAGASLGIPALTAHRCLTVSESGPSRLGPGALAAQTVLVAGGAGAVGHAAIQLARWSGARVITTVSGDEKAKLGEAAGAEHVVNYRSSDALEQIRGLAPNGVDVVVELAPAANAALDAAVLAPNGTVAIYAGDGGGDFELSVGELMARNLRYQFILVYTVPPAAKDQAVADVTSAAADGALPVGEDAGLPLHRYPLEQAADAHAAVEGAAVGKVLIDVPEAS